MVHIITKEQLSEEMRIHFDTWLDFFTTKMNSMSIVPLQCQMEDKNLRAFNSKEGFIECFGGRLHTREFSMLSSFIEPSVVVELGTALGMSSFLLSKLSPQAKLYTVDNRSLIPVGGNNSWEVGHIAKVNKIDCEYMINNSWDTTIPAKFNLCYIDADHGKDSVLKDSMWAWQNKDEEHYAIMWDDYSKVFPGVIASVNEFSDLVGIEIYKLQDSTLAWTYKN